MHFLTNCMKHEEERFVFPQMMGEQFVEFSDFFSHQEQFCEFLDACFGDVGEEREDVY